VTAPRRAAARVAADRAEATRPVPSWSPPIGNFSQKINLLVRRQILQTIGGFNPELSYNENSELAWRIKRAGYRVDFDPKLRVYATDHWIESRGVAQDDAFALGCLLLYLDLIPLALARA
jgi:hypothetical protein